jgi:YVTN family beta-propeller protein
MNQRYVTLFLSATIALAGSTAAASPFAYAIGGASSTVSVIDTTTQQVVSTIHVPAFPVLDVLSPDGSRLYVSSQGANVVAVIDTTANAVIATIPLGAVAGHMAITPDGKQLYVTMQSLSGCAFPACDAVWVISTVTNQVTGQVNLNGVCPGGGCNLSYMAVSPDGARLYATAGGVNKIAVIDTSANSVISSSSAGSGPGLAITRDGTTLYEMNTFNLGLSVIDTASMSVLTSGFPAGCADPQGLALSPDESRLYIPCIDGSSVAVVDRSTLTVVATPSLNGLQPSQVAAFTPDGASAYVAACCTSPGTGTVFVIDTSTGTVTNTIAIAGNSGGIVIGGRNPYAAQIQPPIKGDGSSVFNASRGVVPVKFTLTSSDAPTCALPAASIAVIRFSGNTTQAVNENDFITPADAGAEFRREGCQYVYNLGSQTLGVGNYLVQIKIAGSVVGHAVFALK